MKRCTKCAVGRSIRSMVVGRCMRVGKGRGTLDWPGAGAALSSLMQTYACLRNAPASAATAAAAASDLMLIARDNLISNQNSKSQISETPNENCEMRVDKWEMQESGQWKGEREREGAEVCLCAWKCNHRLLSTCALMRPLRQRQRQRQLQLVEAERQPWSKQQPHQPPRTPFRVLVVVTRYWEIGKILWERRFVYAAKGFSHVYNI